ncbi:MAG: iron-sulfur cluster assembly scaffold protein [Verrucomicrobiota bacterium]
MEPVYQEILIHYSRESCLDGRKPGFLPSHHCSPKNPLCGDQVDLYFLVKEESIWNCEFSAQACAITRASAAILRETLLQKGVEESCSVMREFLTSFDAIIEGEKAIAGQSEAMKALLNVAGLPARRACARMCWDDTLGLLGGDLASGKEL